ncbi:MULTISPECIES: bifunctional 2-polyprenyl-6-hydroxyphenol methylase/3-demethylubiquinol 3-O-methyltransferase UbiG [Bacillus]|uniref:class I SAM-dependent methyltransferase n=1 Tax=Bacillus TaxID=1386 RepID=UPI00273D1A39|nr:class I SAM-dependent methyltransferase [Bacillus sp. MMSF_3328]
MDKLQRTHYKKENSLSKEWDTISSTRFEQLSNHKDLSFEYIIKPFILRELKKFDTSKVIDIGCGTGNLSYLLKDSVDDLIGIDFSKKSVELAKKLSQGITNIQFYHSNIEDFHKKYKGAPFTLAISNMTLMDVSHLEEVLASISNLLDSGGKLFFTIIHPCFWPKYKGYENEAWYNYKEEIFIEGNFNIALEKNQNLTTHIHRPLESYMKALIKFGFNIEDFDELLPEKEFMNKFPSKITYPRFLAITAKKK